jgi:hypothetical protein
MPAALSPAQFIAKWNKASGSERANYQLFITGLCDLIGVEQPDPARDDTRDNAYVFERRVQFAHGDGGESLGFIDCYKRDAFVLEAKKIKAGPNATKTFDSAMLRARGQGEQYARALPAAEGRPPFVIVVDVGRAIELYAEFSRTGATYTPFPDPRTHRVLLADLERAEVRERLALIWRDAMSLDPTRASARVTREVASHLAQVARSLEKAGHHAQKVAGFLTRSLFSMFAEDVGLLPKRAFVDLLERHRDDPKTLMRMMHALWQDMDRGGFCAALAHDVLHFNGKLFKTPEAIELNRDQIDSLLEAAKANWREVEPAIFGTLLEQALDPDERHSSGAHYTPRAYVERLVLPTVIEPLRAEWQDAQAAALLLAEEGKDKEAIAAVHAFQKRLAEVRVLDPACGSGNFLYVTLEHMKRLEGEVLNQLAELGEGQAMLEGEGLSVDPHQFLGLEINPRAAAIAELVLWIGYLQWHFRTRKTMPPEPVLKDFRNIENRDAVLDYDGTDILTDESGKPVMRWDGKTMKSHPVTGKDVPDERAQIAVWTYEKPRKAKWPAADFIVGNPPFIGNKRMRDALGDGYADALRAAWPDVPESADFVMYWWKHAADTVRTGAAQRFGLITTNSLTMIFNRRVIEAQQSAKPPLSVVFAVPDHPWVDTAEGAAVRISMTVGQAGTHEGRLWTSIAERDSGDGEVHVDFEARIGAVHADLKVGSNVAGARRLLANDQLSNRGVIPHGAGFIVSPDEAAMLGLGTVHGLENHIRPYRNGRDLTERPRGALLIDLYGLTLEEVKARYPAVFQWLLERVKPERDQNPERSRRENWWLFARPNTELRGALSGLERYIVTGQVAKHRVFQWLDRSILPDDKLIAIASDNPLHLGVLSSQVHVQWALATGGTLEDRPVYSKSTCFETFPFPPVDENVDRIAHIAEAIDAQRKAQLAAHPDLTLTGMYNVLEASRAGRALNAKEKTINQHGLVSLLKARHDELDGAVLTAYGWSDLVPAFAAGPIDEATREDLLQRLVALNAERAAEEADGVVRWLRPEFQSPEEVAGSTKRKQKQGEMAIDEIGSKAQGKTPWPAALPEQMRAVAKVLAVSDVSLSESGIADRFAGRGPWKRRLPQIIDTLVALGRARKVKGGVRAV